MSKDSQEPVRAENPAEAGEPVERKASAEPLEDRALKLAVQFFGRELLPRFNIPGRIRRIAPAEQVYLEMKDFFEDFNFEMEDGTWIHLEFESDRITEADLRRFHSYEAITAYYYKVEVTTYVLCTASVKHPRTTLRQGINTYRIRVIQMRTEDADLVISELEEKQREGRLTRQELVSVLLTPLMSGRQPQVLRMERSIRLLQTAQELLEKEELLQMESVLYAFALKFLTQKEIRSIKEVFSMTILGQMLEESGIEKGKKQGLKEGKEQGIELTKKAYKLLNQGNSAQEIAEKLQISIEEVGRLID